jgi:integrase/recombinase XerD
MKCTVDNDVVLARPLEGPLSTYIPGFAQWTREQGYAFPTRRWKVHLVACFSRWLRQQAISTRCISSERVTRYLRSRARHVKVRGDDAFTVQQFLDFLRRHGVVPAEKIAPAPIVTGRASRTRVRALLARRADVDGGDHRLLRGVRP